MKRKEKKLTKKDVCQHCGATKEYLVVGKKTGAIICCRCGGKQS